MKIIGLTGSIAMGKSTASAMLACMGVPIFDSDAAVHALMGPGGRALPALDQLFPGAVSDVGLDRQMVGAQVFQNPDKKRALEKLLHPMVQSAQRRWLQARRRERRAHVVLDVPLLFETGGHKRCDIVWAVSAPAPLQRRRALARPGMTQEKLAGILKAQMPDAQKRRLADVVIPSGRGRAATYRALARALHHI